MKAIVTETTHAAAARRPRQTRGLYATGARHGAALPAIHRPHVAVRVKYSTDALPI